MTLDRRGFLSSPRWRPFAGAAHPSWAVATPGAQAPDPRRAEGRQRWSQHRGALCGPGVRAAASAPRDRARRRSFSSPSKRACIRPSRRCARRGTGESSRSCKAWDTRSRISRISARSRSGTPHPEATNTSTRDGSRAHSQSRLRRQTYAADGVVVGRRRHGSALRARARARSRSSNPEQFLRNARLARAEGESRNAALAHVLRVERDVMVSAAAPASREEARDAISEGRVRQRGGHGGSARRQRGRHRRREALAGQLRYPREPARDPREPSRAAGRRARGASRRRSSRSIAGTRPSSRRTRSSAAGRARTKAAAPTTGLRASTS